MRRVVKRRRGEEGREEGAQFLLNKEVSRTKQLMSLRLGGPARGFVLITSRRESERGVVHGGKEETRPLFSSLSLSPTLSPFFSLYSRPFLVTPLRHAIPSFSPFSYTVDDNDDEKRRKNEKASVAKKYKPEERQKVDAKGEMRGGELRARDNSGALSRTRARRRGVCALHYSRADAARDCEFASSRDTRTTAE